jgi:hypothetical protein
LGEGKAASGRRAEHSPATKAGERRVLLKHARERGKEMALIRAHQGTNMEITKHKEMRIKGRSKRGGGMKNGKRKNIG